MTVTAPSYHPINIEGLSADVKPSTWAAPGNPIQPVPPRSSFIETDTGDEFYFTGVLWVLFKLSGAEIPSSVSDNNPITFIDTSFVVGDSPVTLDLNTPLGRNATQFSVQNDGNGIFTVATSLDGAIFGDEKTVKNGEVYQIDALSVHSMRITHVADSSYRVTAL